MKKTLIALALGMTACFSAPLVQAGEDAAKTIEESLKQALPTLKPDSIKPTKIPGLYEVVSGAKLFYVSGDGNYVIQGTMIDVKAKEDLTEPRMAQIRLDALDRVGLKEMLDFKPKKTAHVAYVFTDIDCGYCRKLHSEIDQYMDKGIEIRYLFFPRAGLGSESYNKAVSVWCAKDRNAALTKAKKGEAVESKRCDNPVEKHMALGESFGANGTPMIVTEKGMILPGYVPAAQLFKIMEQERAQAAKTPDPS
jgi:thiol:disulfide interchange protein DsbC